MKGKSKMDNNSKFTENDVIKQAVLMLKNNLLDMKNYLNNTMSPTLKLQKIKIEILKTDDRLNDIYSVLNANSETRLMEAKKLCNILKNEAQAKVEEKKYEELIKQEVKVSNEYHSNTSSEYKVSIDSIIDYMEGNPGCTAKEAEEALINIDKYYDEQLKEYEEYENKIRKAEEKIDIEQKQDTKLYGKEYAIWHSFPKLDELYGSGIRTPYQKSVKELEEDIKRYGDIAVHGISRREVLKQKNYCKYFIKAYKPELFLDNVSKRKLPAEIFKYLFSNGYLNEENINEYSTNQFGRKFEAKRGDIQTEEDMIDNQKNLHRYNKIDFSKIKNSKFNKILYISSEWDYDSITKFVTHINEKFKGIIFADEERIKKSVYQIEN